MQRGPGWLLGRARRAGAPVPRTGADPLSGVGEERSNASMDGRPFGLRAVRRSAPKVRPGEPATSSGPGARRVRRTTTPSGSRRRSARHSRRCSGCHPTRRGEDCSPSRRRWPRWRQRTGDAAGEARPGLPQDRRQRREVRRHSPGPQPIRNEQRQAVDRAEICGGEAADDGRHAAKPMAEGSGGEAARRLGHALPLDGVAHRFAATPIKPEGRPPCGRAACRGSGGCLGRAGDAGKLGSYPKIPLERLYKNTTDMSMPQTAS
ncbi:hypothetical protein MPEAHAMD_0803 [Methylobacterium frigidaeris]|uniref:Uncharacterized protein n=1 Tax=Methylobacterium frigidaeris TaxID=2038277 RepID=A0AA37H821_9HYPH|nr:hypothetical protein MPEAHAMD_0803 [Methylobacterium frigidaeris]